MRINLVMVTRMTHTIKKRPATTSRGTMVATSKMSYNNRAEAAHLISMSTICNVPQQVNEEKGAMTGGQCVLLNVADDGDGIKRWKFR